MLSDTERKYLDALISGDKLLTRKGKDATAHEKNELRKEVMRKLSKAIPDLVLLFNQKTMLYMWLAGQTNVKGREEPNLKLWIDFQNALLRLPFRNGPGEEYPYVFMAGRLDDGSLGYWREDLDHETRRYRAAVSKGDVWKPDFPFRKLGSRAAKAINEALDLGLSIPRGRENAILREELALLVAKERPLSPS